MIYEMKFELDEPQFTQREMLRVIDLPATTLNNWIKRDLLAPFEFERCFATNDESMPFPDPSKSRRYKVFQHDPSARRTRLYSILDTLCLAGIKAVLEAKVEIRYAQHFPVVLCDLWTDVQLFNLGRHSFFDTPIVLYVDDEQLMALFPVWPNDRVGGDTLITERDNAAHEPTFKEITDRMRAAQLTSATIIDWPTIESRVIDRLKDVIGGRGHRSWDTEE